MLAALAVIAVTGLLGLAAPALQSYPPAAQFTTGAFWEGLVQAINVNFFDQLEAVKTFMLLNLLVPVKRFLLGVPWPWLILLVTLAGWQRSEEHTSELQSLMRISYAVFCLTKK